jgi:dolichyl-phosphate-mannose-protein mannosyltransferase
VELPRIRTRDAAILAGLISLLLIWHVWGALDPLAIVADEQSYVLQARIFATGHWTAAAPPIRDFFEQSMVLTAPAVASKYPPGHAILLSLGALVGSVALIPLLLSGLTGALLYLLARRTTNHWVAALTVLIWLGDPINLRFRPSYLSEVTTQALWLIVWWALLEWRSTRATKWLLIIAAAMGWGAITRPLTMLAFAVPVGFVVLRDVIRLKLWRDFAMAFALGTVILGILPLWSFETTGNAKVTPLSAYDRDYLPYDHPGFGMDSTPPRRLLNAVNQFTYAEFFREHEQHTIATLPRVAYERLREIAHSEWDGIRAILIPLIIFGMTGMTAEMAFALACSAALFVGYLSYGHFAGWTLYYFEAMPVFSFFAARGLWRALENVAALAHMSAARTRTVGIAVAVLLAALTAYEVHAWRIERLRVASWYIVFNEELEKLPDEPMVIFVRYRPTISPHAHVVRNSPTLATDAVWIVNDMGDRNKELMRYAGSRVPLIFHEEHERFELDRALLEDH